MTCMAAVDAAAAAAAAAESILFIFRLKSGWEPGGLFK